jgi:hypothetical protein
MRRPWGEPMRSRALIAVPVAAAGVYAVAHGLAGKPGPAFYFVEVMMAKTLALVGCLAAADRFDRGDRTRTLWILFALDFMLLIGKDMVASPVVPIGRQLLGPSLAMLLRGLFMLGANIAGTAAWIILARTWRVAGLPLAGSPAAKSAALTAAIAVSLALVGWGTSRDLFALLGGRSEAALNVISDVADVIGFSLVAPVALTAWTLRGGTLFWPYLYLTACTFVWMLYDMTESLGAPVLGLDATSRHSIEELWRCLACGLHFAAGMAQRWALRGVPSASAAVTVKR